MTWAAEIARPECGVRFYALIEGIPYVFVDGVAPVGPDGTAWTAPTSGAHSYTVLPSTLDVSRGIKDSGGTIIRRTSEVSPSSMTLTLSDDMAGTLLSLFAQQRSDRNVAYVTADVDYDTAGTGSVFTVDDTTGWASTGFAYWGRETIYYPAKAATTLGTAGSKATRGLFSLGYTDTEFSYKSGSYGQGPEEISDHPTLWYGRYVRVFASLVGTQGHCFDSTYLATTYTREVFRGVIRAEPLPNQSWQQWEIPLRSIDYILDTEVVGRSRKGQLAVGSLDPFNGSVSPMFGARYYVTEPYNTLRWTVEDLTAAGPVTDYEVTISDGYYDLADLNNAVSTATAAAMSGGGLHTGRLQIVAPSALANGQTPSINVFFENTSANDYQVRIIGSKVLYDGSLGVGVYSLLSLLGDEFVTIASYVEAGDVTFCAYTLGTGRLAILTPEASRIPIRFAPLELDRPAPQAPGYAKIGEDEIVYYDSVDAIGSVGTPLYELTGVIRGQFGTIAETIELPLTTQGAQDFGTTEVIFGAGFDNVSLFDAILQLSVSTGAGHHGTYDTIGQAAPPLNPYHFDTARFEALRERPAYEHTLRYFQSKPMKLREMIQKWLQPLGLFCHARTIADGTYRITIDEVRPPLEGEAVTEVGHSAISMTSGDFQATIGNLVNQIEVKSLWDAAKEEPRSVDPSVFTDEDSIRKYGQKGTIKWTLQGYPWSIGVAEAQAISWAFRTFARFGRPYRLLSVDTDRLGWIVKPGMTVRITMAGIPNAQGSRGYTERDMVCVSADYTYWPGTGGTQGARLLLEDSTYVRHSSYCPSASVASRSGSVYTLNAADYSYIGTDIEHFEVGDEVFVYDAGNYAATATQGTVDAISGVTMTLSGTGISTYTVTATTKIAAARYQDVQASQRQHAFTADNSPALTVSDTTPFKWV